MQRIVLAYSGGFGTSVAIPWLAKEYGAEIAAVTFDLGQARELADVRERALALGAVRCHVVDVRDEFVRAFILPALQAGAVYEDGYPLATALGRPLMAKRLVEMARMESAAAVAIGGAVDSNDHLRLDVSVRALEPGLTVIALDGASGIPVAERAVLAKEHGLPVESAEPYRIDANLWGRSVACGVLDDPWTEPPGDVYTLTRAPQHCPDEPAYVEIAFEAGVPVRTNGVEMPMLELVESLETIAGAHGVGRIDLVENRVAGSKSREVYEAPAAVVLHAAHRALTKLVITRDLDRLTHDMSRTYADLVYNGQWFSHAREAIDAFVAAVQPRVTGTVRLKLFKGDCRVVGRKSPHALYDQATAHDGSAAPASQAAVG
jgi:argininosuccinate synthase